ncbi:MAG: alpha/beta hydrolase [Verrucomicrobiota bacterium]|nr:alpha/beta hydrolase [Verrucomicrobiota bacterium]
MIKKFLKFFLFCSYLLASEPKTYKTKIACGEMAYWDSKPWADPDEPTLVFLHGHLTNKRFFNSQISSSALREYRIICLDLPGYGESDSPDDPERFSWPGYADSVAEVVQSLGLKNIIIVGWSLGGHVGLELTSRLPQLKGLLITGTPPIEVSAEGFSKGFRIVDPKILACFGKGNLTAEETELLARGNGYDGSTDKQFIFDAIVQTSEGAKVIYPQSILNGVGQNEVEIVRKWTHPIAVVAGADETLVNNEYIMKEVPFRNLWHKRVHLIQYAGHFVHMEQPDAFNELVREFAQDVFKN